MPLPRSPGYPGARPLAVAIALAGLATAPVVQAYTDEELDQKFSTFQDQLAATAPRFSVNGYFTFAGSVADEDGGTYNEASTSDPSFEALSRGALQLEFRINEDTRFVTQLLSRGDQGWQTHAEWAFLAYNVNPDTTVRAGRLRLPVFLFSETLDVGYTQPWVAPPSELYGLLSFSSYEGIDARYRFEAGGADWSFQPYAGYAHLDDWERSSSGGDAYGDEMLGFDLTANHGDLTARIGYFQSKLTIPDFSLAGVAYSINDAVRTPIADSAASGAATGAAIAAAGAAGSGAAAGACVANGTPGPACPASVYTPAYTTAYNATYDATYASVYDSTYASVTAGLPDPDLSMESIKTRFWSMGLRYDNGSLLLLTEYAGAKLEGYFSDTTSCYGTVGYRLGKLMPHLTFSHLRVDDPEEREFSSAAWPYDPDGPGPIPAVIFPNPGGSFIASAFAIDQQSWTAGVRYDFRPGVALKAEATRASEFTAGSSGQWRPDGSLPAPDAVMIYRASVDMVF